MNMSFSGDLMCGVCEEMRERARVCGRTSAHAARLALAPACDSLQLGGRHVEDEAGAQVVQEVWAWVGHGGGVRGVRSTVSSREARAAPYLSLARGAVVGPAPLLPDLTPEVRRRLGL